ANATLHLPRAHDLEAWGDSRTADGQIVLIQPLIYPLFGGRSAIELLALLAGESTDGHAQVRQTFTGTEKQWRKALHDGFVENTGYPVAQPPKFSAVQASELKAQAGYEVVFRRDYKVFD